ncbi:MAG TPA: DUF2530 domain-containing protein [Candidatus Nanopelagicales bacterium]|nr:DUF2530 domain-containing protein [Candidatus Nanopelagicales bacterium]
MPSDDRADAPIDLAHLAPVDVDGVRAVATGTVVWTVLLVLCLLLRDQLASAGRGWWTGVCLAGALLGAVGLVFVRWRRDRIAARRAAAS